MPTKTVTPAKTKGYAPVRMECDSGHEWLDMDCYACLLDMAQDAAKERDVKLTMWSKANPVVRYALVTVEEQVL